MKNILFLFSIGFYLISNAQTPAWDWVKGATTANSTGTGVATDNVGNIYFTGTCGNPFTIDTYTLTNQGSYLAKSNSNGNISWIKNIINARISAVAVDANSSIYIAGTLTNSSTAYFDSFYLYGDGFKDIFIAKYDASGNAIWVKKCGGNYYDEFNSLTLDGNGNPIITGIFSSDSIMFDNISVVNTDLTTVSNAMYVAKYDVNGNALWAHTAVGNNNSSGCYSQSVTSDGSNIYIGGYFDCNTVTFGSFTLNRSGADDVFLAKYDASGNIVWAKKQGGQAVTERTASPAITMEILYWEVNLKVPH